VMDIGTVTPLTTSCMTMSLTCGPSLDTPTVGSKFVAVPWRFQP